MVFKTQVQERIPFHKVMAVAVVPMVVPMVEAMAMAPMVDPMVEERLAMDSLEGTAIMVAVVVRAVILT